MRIRTYRELRRLETFEERFRYLSLKGQVAEATFGFDRYINQAFYKSSEWLHARNEIIVRDNGCDMGVPGFEIFGRVIIHHMNPIDAQDIAHGGEILFDPNQLICVSHQTHNAIHYGDERQLPRQLVERKSGDTALW